MDTLERIDGRILALFTKFSHWFQCLTGRTNYFLAKISLFLTMTAWGVGALGYWLPILERRFLHDILTPICFLMVLPDYIMRIYLCDKSEESLFQNDERTKYKISDPIDGSMGWRIFWTFAVILSIPLSITSVLNNEGVLFFKIINNGFASFVWMASYFLEVDPLPPGKSKIRQWIEDIQAGFRKLQPLPSGK